MFRCPALATWATCEFMKALRNAERWDGTAGSVGSVGSTSSTPLRLGRFLRLRWVCSSGLWAMGHPQRTGTVALSYWEGKSSLFVSIVSNSLYKSHVIKVAIAHMLPCSAIYCLVMAAMSAAKIQVQQPNPALATALAEDAWHREISKCLQILITAVHVGSVWSVWTRTRRTCLERPKEISEMSMCLS